MTILEDVMMNTTRTTYHGVAFEGVINNLNKKYKNKYIS